MNLSPWNPFSCSRHSELQHTATRSRYPTHTEHKEPILTATKRVLQWMWYGQEDYENLTRLRGCVKDMAKRHLEDVVIPPDERFVLKYDGKESLLKLVHLQDTILGCPVVCSFKKKKRQCPTHPITKRT